MIGVGGFLGVGEHLVALPFDKVKFVNEPIAYTGAAAGGNTGTRPGSTTTTGAASSAPAATPAKPNPWYPDHAVISATKDAAEGDARVQILDLRQLTAQSSIQCIG